ncbi:MAG TPA: hypothetical protein VL328_01775 [Gemmatimonadaceae bacterium]|nr:hypothetical protein [Gemmatimonadaceae bacterium]
MPPLPTETPMSRAGVPRTVAALAVLAAATSLVSCNFNKDSVALVETLAPDVNTVHIDFSCGATTSIGLTDGSGNSAWAVVRHPNNSIQWVVPLDVTINSIAGKTEALPITHNPGDPQGGSPGTPFKGKVKGGANGTYHYVITASCDPGGGAPPLNLSIDPEMIVR